MKRSTKFALAGALLLAAVLMVLWRVAAVPEVPEEQRISERLEEIRLAIEQRDLKTIMDAISKDFDAFGYSPERLRIEIASAFRRGIQPSVRYNAPVIRVSGKQATVDMRVEVWWEDMGTVSHHEPTDIRLTMRKEPARKWLVFPTEKWRVVDVEGISIDGLE